MNLADTRAAWRRKVEAIVSPHYATASTLLKPQNVDVAAVGHHISVVFEPGSGLRHFVFVGQQNRDRFINRYRGWDAKPCGDPLKGVK